MLGVGIVGVRAQFEACRRDYRSSSPVRGLESGLEQFEPSSMGFKDFEPSWRLVDRIVGVRAQFSACRRDCRSSSPVRCL